MVVVKKTMLMRVAMRRRVKLYKTGHGSSVAARSKKEAIRKLGAWKISEAMCSTSKRCGKT